MEEVYQRGWYVEYDGGWGKSCYMIQSSVAGETATASQSAISQLWVELFIRCR